MTETTTLGLLRHGQTDWNVDFRLQGVTDIPLNETGLAQARAAAAVLRSGDWDVLLTSPLVRASKTAQIVAESFGGRAAELGARRWARAHGILGRGACGPRGAARNA